MPRLTTIVLCLLLMAGPASAQTEAGNDQPVVLTLDEAIQIALVSNSALQSLRLDKENADAQIQEGWAQLFPSVDVSSSFTRNLKSANPFSGSSAGGLFQSLGFLDWLAFNEQARTDGDGTTDPISIAEFFARQQAGLDAAGVPATDGGDNPFSVPSQYAAVLSITQKIFDGRAILGAAGASKWLSPLNEAGIQREEQLLIDSVRRTFYGALLAQEQVDVTRLSAQRAAETLEEVSRQVAGGVAPKFQRLSAEVELANLETQLVQSDNAAAGALDNLKLLLGVPAERPVSLRGSLGVDRAADALLVDDSVAIREALERRPDLEQAHINIELQDVQLKVAQSEYLPTVDAFLNIGYIGNVPDTRLSVISDANDPFSFVTQSNGYFSDAYWDRTMSVGFRLQWNVFDGLGSRRRVQQRKIAVEKARIDREFLERSVMVEVERTLRDLRAAYQRMQSQERNVERAELNYSYADARLKEGMASPIEIREASSQLDQSRLNYLQAAHDYLVALSAYETALGTPPAMSTR